MDDTLWLQVLHEKKHWIRLHDCATVSSSDGNYHLFNRPTGDCWRVSGIVLPHAWEDFAAKQEEEEDDKDDAGEIR